ncbi:MAG: hypothetical protein ACYS8Z_09785 [Planctomycetota bacterium]
MKVRTGVSFVFVCFVLLTSGCPRPPEEGQVMLPADIAGTWQARGNPWKIALNPDGTVSSAYIDMGGVEVAPNKTTRVEMKDGQFSTYKAGDCIVEYTPESRDLYVRVEIEDMHIVYLDNVIDGNSVDRFVGPVSEDGKVWSTDWIKVFDYGPRFPQDANDITPEPLVFDKIAD